MYVLITDWELPVIAVLLVGLGVFLVLREDKVLRDLGIAAFVVAAIILLLWSGLIWNIVTTLVWLVIVFVAFRYMFTGKVK